MPEVAPVAVEPRKIEEPTKPQQTTSTLAKLEQEAAAEAAERNGSGALDLAEPAEKKGLPLIPIIAGVVALLVVGLLAKVVLAK